MGVTKKVVRNADGSVRFQGWQVRFKDNATNKWKTRSFKSKSEANGFERGLSDVFKVKRIAERRDLDVDAVLSDLVESGEIFRKGPVERNLAKFDTNRTALISTLVPQFLTACEKGRDGRKPLRESSLDTYRQRLAPFVADYGHRSAASITKTDMRAYRDKLLDTCGTRQQARNVLSMSSIFFDYLIDDLDMSLKNPARGVRIDVGQDEEIETAVDIDDIYSDEDIEKILSTSHGRLEKARSRIDPRKYRTVTLVRSAHRDRVIVILLVYCGLRIGEALALTWEDVDLDQSLLTVNKTLSQRGKVTLVKSRAGRRRIAIPKQALDVLKEYKEHSPYPHIAGVEGGGYISYHNAHKSWVRLIKKAGVKYRNLHKLRHYYASKLIDAGYDDHRLTTMIGHEDIAFTRKVYGHLLNRRTRVTKDVEAINLVFGA